jgi:hypothetical protein
VFVLLGFFDAPSSRFPEALCPLPCLPEPEGSYCFLWLLELSFAIMNSALLSPSLETAVACVWLRQEKWEPFLVDWFDGAGAGSGPMREGLVFVVRRSGCLILPFSGGFRWMVAGTRNLCRA